MTLENDTGQTNFGIVNSSNRVCQYNPANILTPVPSHGVLVFHLIALPIISVFGITGNLLSLYILHPLRTRISGHIYLACLAVFDTLSLLLYVISFWNIMVLVPYLYQQEYYDAVNLIQRYFMSQGRCEPRVYLNFLFRMLSVWTVVILSMERFLLIVSPLRFYKFLRPRVAWITMGLCTLTAGLTSTPWLFSFSYIEKYQCISKLCQAA
ncbi:hypothetical protein AHF37_02318 [Paragonimus kellicotti]|nr:hypothetical protein AHF37_02318 [Paragonimus kellicotti]